MSNLISVIIPVYKAAESLCRTVDSVIGQSYDNLEVILVDDGSPDESPEICDELARQDARIKVIHKDNGGVSESRNVGVAAANGDYIGFVDADDLVDPNMYGRMLDAMLVNDAQIACCCVKKVYGDRVVCQEFPRDKIYSRRKALYELIRSKDLESFPWNKLYRRDMLGDNPFPVGRALFEDMLAMPAIFQRADKIVHVNSNLYTYFRHDKSALGTWDLNCQAQFTRAHQDRYLEVEPLWPEFGPLMVERYAWSLNDLCNRALKSTPEEMKACSELLSGTLYPFYQEHRALLEPYATEAALKKYDVLLGKPALFASLWPTVRKVRTGLYNLKHR